MIYAYKYLTYKIVNYHSKIGYFFSQLFLHDPKDYDENLLLEPDFVPVVNASPERLRGNLEKICKAYHSLKKSEKLKVQQAFSKNNQIETLCGDIAEVPVRYDDLNKDFKKLLKDFYKMLWEEYPQNKNVSDDFGTVQEHFTAFTTKSHQTIRVCPFCGLNKMKPSGSINHNAYDHYLPQRYYPFIGIQFNNLFPACHECNSDEKKDVDTLYDGKTRRLVFYPYDTSYDPDQLNVAINPKHLYSVVDFKTLLDSIEWEFDITLAGAIDERIKTWDSVFKIKRRFRENMLYYEDTWFEELMNRYRSEIAKGTGFNEFKREILADAKYLVRVSPLGILKYSYYNFLFSDGDFEMKLSELTD